MEIYIKKSDRGIAVEVISREFFQGDVLTLEDIKERLEKALKDPYFIIRKE